ALLKKQPIKRKKISDRDIEAIVNDETLQAPEHFHLELVQVSCGDHARPTATVTLLTPDGTELTDAAIGTGPVDAVYKAVNRVVDLPNELIEYSVQSVTAGIDAMGEVTIRLRHGDRIFSGHAANTDIVVASTQAYINALNRLYAAIQQGVSLHPQHQEMIAASAERTAV
ncbi:MAG: 2-isopropylmalate synthase, partial [Leptolyngbyaceae cyanobacterium RM2_2_21]|nr:2-isopropylmalate synthase [Leptolyngbyaceae cyanobacterium RM2_2_21]